jgi:hypothetical protein
MNEEDLDYAGYEPEEEEVVDAPAKPDAAAEVAKSKKSPAAAAVEPEVVRVAPVSSASSVAGIVLLSSLKFESNALNSLSVALVQERLIELGFYDAGSDNRGWLSQGTRKALALYAGLSEDAVAVDDAELIKKLFAGTAVTLSI